MTSKHERCPKCLGSKKYKNLGNMSVDCDLCKGVGYVEVTPVIETKKEAHEVKVSVDLDNQKQAEIPEKDWKDVKLPANGDKKKKK